MNEIKYHDSLHGEQYGPDHQLTNNWNPEPIYEQDEYIKVYFRIEAKNWNYAEQGFSVAELWEQFFAEMREILDRFNIPEGTGHRTESLPGMEHLHIHPQMISGVVAKNKIKAIAEALNACETVSCPWVDVYDDISTMDNTAFRAALAERTEEIESDLLQAFTTKRKNLYIVPSCWSGPIAELSWKYAIRRRSCESGQDGVCCEFLFSIFEKLVEAGKIVSAETKNGTGYRTAKKDEQKTA